MLLEGKIRYWGEGWKSQVFLGIAYAIGNLEAPPPLVWSGQIWVSLGYYGVLYVTFVNHTVQYGWPNKFRIPIIN